MVIKVGINGFGRIGRIMFRTCFQNSDIEVSAINDPAIDVKYLCYLIKFDSTHGKFDEDVIAFKDDLKINGKLIKIFHEKQPSAIPWQSAGVQYVIESTGIFTSLETALGHLSEEGVRRVIVTAPSVDVPMIILGVNGDKLHIDQKIISCASSTLYCLAPIMKVLEYNYGVSEGFVTSVHAMTPSLKPLDGLCLRGKHWRDHRSIHQNIIPATTGACKALGKILPQLKDKMVGMAFRVPIVNVSVLDLTIRLNTDTTLQNIVKCVEIASKTSLKGIIKISREEAVSSDFIGDSHSCILDVNSSMQLKPNFYKLICWYENEFSYACRVIDSIMYSERQFCAVQNNEGRYLNIIGSKKNLTSNCPEGLKQCTNVRGDWRNMLSNDLRNFSKKTNRSVFEKRPLSAEISVMNQSTIVNYKTKSKSDVFKVIDYDSVTDKTSAIMSNYSFNQNSITSERNNAKIQNRLENVRKDFNKMMNITEDLLKKSYKLNFHGLKKSISNNSTISNTELKKETDSTVTNSNIEESFVGTNNTNSVLEFNNSVEHKCIGCLINVNKNNDEDVAIPKSSSEENKNIGMENMRIHASEIVSENVIHYKYIKSNEGKDKIENLEENMIPVTNLHESSSSNSQSNVSMQIVVEQKKNTLNSKTTDSTEQAAEALNEEHDLAIQRKFENQIHNNFSDDNILKVGNIIICKDGIDISKALKHKCIENITEYITLGKHDDEKEQNEGNISRQRIIKSRRQNALYKTKVTCQNISLCASQGNTNTSISTEANTIKEDIYDKLDSASASNSENSFHVNEKQSQVIYINDLTNSLEDLAQLEKICKIIEISDDLSDELFSKLQISDVSNFKNKKWSFKDFCDKIKLDDFCNKVFGECNH